MGHGKGRGGTESGMIEGGAPAFFNVRSLDMLSQEWLSQLSAQELEQIRMYFKFHNTANKQQMQDMLDKAPTYKGKIDAYLPVNKDTIHFVRALAERQVVGANNMRELHLWKSTALESSSKSNRLVHLTIEPDMHIGGVTSMGGRDLRAPKLYIKNALYKVTGTHQEGSITVYDVSVTNRPSLPWKKG